MPRPALCWDGGVRVVDRQPVDAVGTVSACEQEKERGHNSPSACSDDNGMYISNGLIQMPGARIGILARPLP